MFDSVLVSVVMCVNKADKEYLYQAVDSILKQSHCNFELIIVDCCFDNNKTFYDDSFFANSKIHIVNSNSHNDTSTLINMGIKFSKGKYIVFTDSNCILHRDRLRTQLSFLEFNPDYVACSSFYKEFQGRNSVVKLNIDDFEYYRCGLFFNNDSSLHIYTLMCRASFLKGISFDDIILLEKHWLFWVMLSEFGKIKNIPEILSFQRVYKNDFKPKSKKNLKIDNKNILAARKYLKRKIGVHLSNVEDKALFLTNSRTGINPFVLASAIKKLQIANEKTHYYDPTLLTKKCDIIWKSCIEKTNNIFYLLCGLFTPNNKIMAIKKEQIINKLRRAKYNKQKKYLISDVVAGHSNCPSFNNVMCYYWDKVDNFGDYLSSIVFKFMTKNLRTNPNNKQKILYGIGSILNLVTVDSVVWGSGLRQDGDATILAKRGLNIDFRLVRGPLTHQKLVDNNMHVPKIYGDPALILPLIYVPNISLEKSDYLVVAHYIDYSELKTMVNPNSIVNAGTKDYRRIIDRIVNSKKVISTSLHGIILAEAYGVPAIWLKNNSDLDDFKFLDYYYSTNRKTIIKAYSINEAISMKAMDIPSNLKELQKNIIESFPIDIFYR